MSSAPQPTVPRPLNPSAPRPFRLLALGDSAAYLEFSQELDLDVNAVVQALALALRAQAHAWITDVVPTLGGVALHFDLDHSALPESPLDAVRKLAEQSAAVENIAAAPPRLVEVPVCYDTEFAPDLSEIAQRVQLSEDEVIRRHSRCQYRVLMMGFVPGHPYLGGLDPSLMVPRRPTPRPIVPAGSIAIANLQSVIYPFATPGGWNLIGRTPLALFDAQRDLPCLLAPCDAVQFVPISTKEFLRLQRMKA